MAAKQKAGGGIDISLRFRPLPKSCKQVAYELDPDGDDGRGGHRVVFKLDKDMQQEVINNAREEYNFKFDNIFDQNAQQVRPTSLLATPLRCPILCAGGCCCCRAQRDTWV